jgi:hypothetical protein
LCAERPTPLTQGRRLSVRAATDRAYAGCAGAELPAARLFLRRENELPFNGSFLTDVARPRYQAPRATTRPHSRVCMDVEHWALVAWERTKKDGVLSMAARVPPVW